MLVENGALGKIESSFRPWGRVGSTPTATKKTKTRKIVLVYKRIDNLKSPVGIE